jgi:hypothetical protein
MGRRGRPPGRRTTAPRRSVASVSSLGMEPIRDGGSLADQLHLPHMARVRASGIRSPGRGIRLRHRWAAVPGGDLHSPHAASSSGRHRATSMDAITLRSGEALDVCQLRGADQVVMRAWHRLSLPLSGTRAASVECQPRRSAAPCLALSGDLRGGGGGVVAGARVGSDAGDVRRVADCPVAGLGGDLDLDAPRGAGSALP